MWERLTSIGGECGNRAADLGDINLKHLYSSISKVLAITNNVTDLLYDHYEHLVSADIQILLCINIYQSINFCLYCFSAAKVRLCHVLLQDFIWLLWAFHTGRAPVLLLICPVGAHLGADWTLASHGRCVTPS